MAPYINIHTHISTSTNDLQVLVLNPKEWKSNIYSDKELYTVGVHPWHSNADNLTEQLAVLEEAIQKPNVIALGEIGLDRSIDIPLQVQESVLKQQIGMAKQCSKPLVFHAVRTIPSVLSICRQEKVQQPIIFHGFLGKPEAVQQINKANGHVSFGAQIIENRIWDKALKEAYELKNLFFETDESTATIDAVYKKASEVLGIELSRLKEEVYSYFCSVFGETVKTIYATK